MERLEKLKEVLRKSNPSRNRDIRFRQLKLEKRDEDPSDDGYLTVDGKAVDINTSTCLYGEGDDAVYEIIEPGAFDDADMTDVVLNVNHGSGNYAVARTRNSTLSFDIDDSGVMIHAKLKKDNQRCMQFYQDVSEGLLDRMSFAFTIADEEFDEESSTFHVRKIAKVFDVSAVEFPAYENTSISAARSADLDRLVKELESRAAEDKAKLIRDEIRSILGGSKE